MKQMMLFGWIFIMLMAATSASAQLMPGMIDMSPRVTIRSRVGSRVGRDGSGGLTAKQIETNRQIAVGEAKIKAGKATTTFTPTLAGTRNLVSSIKWGAHEPQTFAGQLKHSQDKIKLFNELLTESKMKVNDSVDGATLAYAIARKIINNDQITAAEFAEWREKYRSRLIDNAYYQGRPDVEKQYNYEILGLFAIEALDDQLKARTAGTASEREQAQARANTYAQTILDKLK